MRVKINNNIFNVKTLLDKKSTSNGMMNRTDFPSGINGLLFLMDGNNQCFWMKNCKIKLDIIIIKNNTITKIHHNCDICDKENCPTYCGNGNIVLEIKGGSCRNLGISENDNVEYIF